MYTIEPYKSEEIVLIKNVKYDPGVNSESCCIQDIIIVRDVIVPDVLDVVIVDAIIPIFIITDIVVPESDHEFRYFCSCLEYN